MTAAICGAVTGNPIDGDCICLEPPHDFDVPHLCTAPACGREWFDKPLKTVRGTA